MLGELIFGCYVDHSISSAAHRSLIAQAGLQRSMEHGAWGRLLDWNLLQLFLENATCLKCRNAVLNSWSIWPTIVNFKIAHCVK